MYKTNMVIYIDTDISSFSIERFFGFFRYDLKIELPLGPVATDKSKC